MKYYNLSKDYEKLYKLICKGAIIAGFTDYDWRDGTEPCRDIVKIHKIQEQAIEIGVRGMSYGSLHPSSLDRRHEKERFLSRCERGNLEWIDQEKEAKGE